MASTRNEPRNGVAKRSRAKRADCGPMKPADDAAGQHQRNRFRRERELGHFGRREPVLQADGVVDADDAGGERRRAESFDRHSATAPKKQPAMLMSAPVMKPGRRPTRAIHSDIGIVASAEPSTYVVAPNVAYVLVGASE